MALYKISSSRVNNIEATDFVGGITENGLIWYDEFTGLLRLYTGEPGGKIINGGGNSTPSEIVNGTSNVRVYPDGNVAVSVNGIANVAVFGNSVSTFDNIDAAGNISAEFFIGDGSQLTGLPPTYTDANVVSLLGNFGSNTINTAGNISAEFFIGDGSQLTGLPPTYTDANVAAFLPTYTGNLVSLTGNVVTTANIQADYFIGNGSQLSGIVATDIGVLSALTVTGNIVSGNINNSGNINSLGTVSAQFFVGDGSKLTGITAQGLPTQVGNAGLFLSTDGENVFWNGALGSSLTFNGGVSESNEFGAELDGGSASDNFIGSTTVLGGFADSDFDLTLSSLALTGQAEDVLSSQPPLTANSTGARGQLAFDSNYLYICVATNNWKRVDLDSW
jgi:hypothetical protein